jgi:hypothetical protein
MMNVMNKSPHAKAVMAGLVPAIHDLTHGSKDVDARDKPGHDDADRSAP